MSLPDSPVAADDIETDPSEDEEEVEEEIEEEEEEEVEEEVEEEEIEEEVEEEEIKEEVEKEEVEEEDVEEEDVEEEDVEEEDVEEEEVEEEEVEEVEEEEEETGVEEGEEEVEEGEQEVEEVDVEEEEMEEEEEDVEEEEDEGEQEVKEGGRREGEVEDVEQEVEEEEGEEDNQEQEEAVEDKKEEQQQQQKEAVEEKKREQQEEAAEEKKKEQEQQHEEAVEEKKKKEQLQQEEAMEEKEGQQKQEEAMREDTSAVTGSLPDAHKDRKDFSLHKEAEEQDKNLGPDSSVAANPEVMPPSSVHCMEENDAILKISVPSCEILTSKKEEHHHLKCDISSHSKSRENLTYVENSRSQGLKVDGENAGSFLQKETHGGYSELGCNSKANLYDDNEIDSKARAPKSSSDTGQDMVIGVLPKDCFVEGANGGQNSRNNIMQLEMESRDDMKQMPSRTRSPSPSADIKNRNKRPKIICDFFAKGWCIRGSSCNFLHIKDTVDNMDQEAEADSVTAHQKRKLKVEEGVGENVQRIRMNEQEEIPSWYPSQEKQNFTPRDNLFPENRFAFTSTSNYFSPNQNGMATLRNQHMYKGYASTLLSHSPNSSLVTQFPASSMSLSHRISAQSGCSLPFSSSLGPGNVNSQKLLSTDKKYLTSKSTFSGSGREDFPLVSSSTVPSYPTGYKSKICSYDWEPSVPFRPSFFITSMNVSSPGDLYDPLRDSIEIPNIGDGSLKASLLIQGSNAQASSQAPIYGDSAVVGKHMSSLNDDKSSVSSHNKCYENEPNKNSAPHEKDYLPTETEITSGTYVNYQNGKIVTGENTFGVADSAKRERDMTEHDARRLGEGSRHKTKRVDKDKKNHEMDVDFHMDGSMQKESKALKMLRAALVDHVKELLKPVWHEGRLSKDAHIMIVRKSVDKVVSTIEPHQIPTTDTAKQYVSSSRVKIAKLVNGYVNKYGKS